MEGVGGLLEPSAIWLNRRTQVYLVFPYIPTGDLCDHILRTGVPLSTERAMAAARSVYRTLQDMHARGVAHGDVSLENILVKEDGDGPVVLTDMGSCTFLDEERSSSYKGKPGYMPPEVVRGYGHLDPCAVDMWQLGVCLFAMVTGHLLYQTPQDAGFVALADGDGLDSLLLGWRIRVGPDVRAALRGLLCFDPAFRGVGCFE